MKGLTFSALILTLSSTVYAQQPTLPEQLIQVHVVQTLQKIRLKPASTQPEMVFSRPSGTLQTLKKDSSEGFRLLLPQRGELLIQYPTGRLLVRNDTQQTKTFAPHQLRLSCPEGRLNVEVGTGLELVDAAQ